MANGGRNIGPWTGPEFDLEYAKSTPWTISCVLEVELFHDDGSKAGYGLLLVLRPDGRPRLYRCSLSHASGEYYAWWAFDSGRYKHPRLFRCMNGAGDDDEVKYKKDTFIPIYAWRCRNSSTHTFALNDISWISASSRDDLTTAIHHQLKELAKDGYQEQEEGMKDREVVYTRVRKDGCATR
ncbi:unnamed protein product [Prorocentrum cordatum]|uniref:Uncharacterized protein n=1 Tax=Prorocentrum cordatum TaxID=2364126 RepID=A0ABN9XH76_9DINO|nr:unnamed protein product [Polarella glacialis]